jgi:hypothetical protein
LFSAPFSPASALTLRTTFSSFCFTMYMP